MAAGTLYTYPENFRAYKAIAAASISGFNLTVDGSFQYGTTNKTPEFMAKFPLGKVPALETSSGVCLNESNAIAVFVSNDSLVGTTKEAKAKITQWMNFADQEITPAVCTWVFPCMGIMQYNKTNSEKAKVEVQNVMGVLDAALKGKTYLVGDSVTLADLSVATTLLLAYQWVMDPAFRGQYANVNKWFEALVKLPAVKKAVPAEFKMCDKMAQFDAKKYAEMSGGEKKKAGGDKKKAGNKEQPKKEEKKEEKPVEMAEETPVEKKPKNPFDAMPASETFIMDEWKKIYSNEDTPTVAMPWFWKNFDQEKYSAWYGCYGYNESLNALDFMNMNLIGGMLQRLDGLRKHGFGVNAYFNGPEKTLKAVYIAKGQSLPFEVSKDLNVDAESYHWRKLDLKVDADKTILTEYWMCDGKFEGLELHACKVFK